MTTIKDKDTILLSIHPEHAEAILGGVKKIEFRKGNIPRHVRNVVLYATKPTGSIVGYFSVVNVVVDRPANIWQRFHRVAGVKRSLFDHYYEGSSTSVGLVVGEVRRSRRQVCLKEVDESLVAPNSFRYLGAHHIEALQAFSL